MTTELLIKRDGRFYRIDSREPLQLNDEHLHVEELSCYAIGDLLPTDHYSQWEIEIIRKEYFDFVGYKNFAHIAALEKQLESTQKQLLELQSLHNSLNRELEQRDHVIHEQRKESDCSALILLEIKREIEPILRKLTLSLDSLSYDLEFLGSWTTNDWKSPEIKQLTHAEKSLLSQIIRSRIKALNEKLKDVSTKLIQKVPQKIEIPFGEF